MKLDYNRVQSEEKKQMVLRFQKWAIRVLGDSYKKEERKRETRALRYEKTIEKMELLPFDYQGKTYSMEEFSVLVNRSNHIVRREIKLGNLHPYKEVNGYGYHYVFTDENVEEFEKRR